MGLWRRIGWNKLFFLTNVVLFVYQFYHYNAWLKEQTRAIDAIKLPDCPSLPSPPSPEVIIQEVTKKVYIEKERQRTYTSKGCRWDKWDFNWDRREASPGAVIRSRATRYIYMVRHGQYIGYGSEQGHLSPMGKKQANIVGGYLKNLNYTWHRFIASTSVRAAETADIIHRHYLPPGLHREDADVLVEGKPTWPEPPFSQWSKDDPEFAKDGPRLASAFERYIHRAEPSQAEDSNELIIAHGNVISYFILRALQLPPERWLKISVLQASMTLFMIGPDSHVTLKYVGDIGFIPKKDWSG